MSFRRIWQLIGSVLSGISDFLVVQNWDRALELFLTGSSHRILDRMSDDEFNSDWSKPYMFKPLCLTEIAYPESDSDTDDEEPGDNPRPRSGHRVVCIGNNIYSFGGYDPQNSGGPTLFGELWRFDLVQYRWSRLLGPEDPGMPEELASMAICTSGNYILIFGGSGLPFGGQNSNRLHLCDTTKNPPLLTEIANTAGEKPLAMYGQAMIVQDQYLYVVGGTSGRDYHCDVHRFDLKTRTWELIGPSRPDSQPTDPMGRYRHELAIDSEFIYLLGGGTINDTFPLDVLSAFHLASRKWVQIKTEPDPRKGEFPAPRKFHSLAQLANGKVFIAGGRNDSVTLRDIWRLDLATRTWAKLDKCRLPYRLFFHDAAATADGCMFLFGGVRGDLSGSRTNKLFKVFVEVPTLRGIAAESVRHWMRLMRGGDDLSAHFHDLPDHCRQYLL